jgi:hypothetical protein
MMAGRSQRRLVGLNCHFRGPPLWLGGLKTMRGRETVACNVKTLRQGRVTRIWVETRKKPSHDVVVGVTVRLKMVCDATA